MVLVSIFRSGPSRGGWVRRRVGASPSQIRRSISGIISSATSAVSSAMVCAASSPIHPVSNRAAVRGSRSMSSTAVAMSRVAPCRDMDMDAPIMVAAVSHGSRTSSRSRAVRTQS